MKEKTNLVKADDYYDDKDNDIIWHDMTLYSFSSHHQCWSDDDFNVMMIKLMIARDEGKHNFIGAVGADEYNYKYNDTIWFDMISHDSFFILIMLTELMIMVMKMISMWW